MHSYERNRWPDRERYRDRDRGRDMGEFNKPMRGRKGYGGGYSSHTRRRGNDLYQRDSTPLLFYGQPPLKGLDDWKNKGLKFSGPERVQSSSNEEREGEDLDKADNQPPDTSVPSIEEAYNAYREKYMSRVQDAFIKEHSGQEWFIDRYHPMAIHCRLKEERLWAESCAQRFVTLLSSNPSEFIESAHLNPIKRDWGDRTVVEEDESSCGSVTKPDAYDMERHGTCCVLLRKLPAWVTRKALEDEIIAAVGDLERLVISDATKSKDQKFMRNGYIVFASKEEAKAAARRINRARISCPNSCIVPRGRRGEDELNSTHELAAFHFRPKGFDVISDAFSSRERLEKDTIQAETLAMALDEERKVPENFRLVPLLTDEAICNALKESNNSAAKLDLILSYLNSVHMYMYYGGVQCIGEGDLLNCKMFRRAVAPAVAASASRGSSTTGEEQEAVEAKEVLGDEVIQAGSSGEEEEKAADKNPDASAICESVVPIDEDGSNIADTSTEKALKDKDYNHNDKTTSSSPPDDLRGGGDKTDEKNGWVDEDQEYNNNTSDETQFSVVDLAYTKRLEEAQPDACAKREAELEKQLEECSVLESEAESQWIETNSITLENGTAKCGIEGCGKLFRNAVFLQKHMRNKHSEERAASIEVKIHSILCSAFELDPLKPIPTIPIYKKPGNATGRDQSHRDRVGDIDHGKSRGRERGRDRDWERGSSHPPHFHDTYMMAMPPPMLPGVVYHPYGVPNIPIYDASILPPPTLHHQDIEPTDPRQMVGYMDIDAPKVETPKVSYGEPGSFLPPPKKRRKSKMLDMEMELEGEGAAGGSVEHNVAEVTVAKNE